MAEEFDQNQSLGSERIATLADGVFAIVLTLLVIDLKAPEGVSSPQLLHLMGELGPKFFAYVLTFGIASIFWFGHHMEFHYIKRSDRTHIWLNLLFMMAIGFLPFSASLLGNNLTQPIASAFYGIHLAILGFIRYFHWRYATDHHRLVDSSMSDDLIHEVSGTFLWVPCAYLCAAAVSFMNVYASLVFYIALALRYVFSAKQDRHLTSLKPVTGHSQNQVAIANADKIAKSSVVFTSPALPRQTEVDGNKVPATPQQSKSETAALSSVPRQVESEQATD